MKKILAFVSIVLLVGLGYSYNYYSVTNETPEAEVVKQIVRRVKHQSKKSNGYIVFVDYGQPSREYRLSIYDEQNEVFIYSGTVMHGCGNPSTATNAAFSNIVGSKCSSLGLFRVGKYTTMPTYKIPCFLLYGLDNTNSNALKRGIMIHPGVTPSLQFYEHQGENFPLTPECEGCITVSLCTFHKIYMLAKTGKPIYIFTFAS